jgi:transcriptional regulator with XRE-family HTH domain
MQQKPEDILRIARESKRWTQTDMANKLGVSMRQYQKYEEGKFPKFKGDVAKSIDVILGTNLYDLIYEQNVPHETMAEEEELEITGYREKYIESLKRERDALERENKRLQKDLDLSLGELRHNILLARAVSETTQELVVEYLEKGNKKKIVELIDTVGIKNLERYQKLKEEGNFPYVGK